MVQIRGPERGAHARGVEEFQPERHAMSLHSLEREKRSRVALEVFVRVLGPQSDPLMGGPERVSPADELIPVGVLDDEIGTAGDRLGDV